MPLATICLVLAGADTHDVRAADDETFFTAAGGILDTSARQRQTGGLWRGPLYAIPVDAERFGARGSLFEFRRRAVHDSQPRRAAVVQRDAFDPRIGITRRINSHFALNASAFRAYRAPTQNELYRTGQVGQQTTLPNHNLRSERATGWETGFQTDMPRLGRPCA